MTELGGNIIFLVSAPRSGSTLLQHILGGHSLVHTLPEPWVLLHLVFALRGSELVAPYNAMYAHLALEEFMEAVPGARKAYDDGIRSLVWRLYSEALKGSGKTYFLDKTTRYYLIIPELRRIFPRAKFVFLLRNPLAIFSSILETSLDGDFRGLFQKDRKADLLLAPRLMLQGLEILGDDAIVVRYEKLVTEPEVQIKRLSDYLSIPFESGALDYGEKVRFVTERFVDPKSVYAHSRPTDRYVKSWPEGLDTAQKLRLAESYLDSLGRDLVGRLGYSFDELGALIESNKRGSVLPVSSWQLLCRSAAQLALSERFWLAFTNGLQVLNESFRRHGFTNTVKRVTKYLQRWKVIAIGHSGT